MLAFYGRYDAENPALIDVLAARAAKQKKKKSRYLDSEAQLRLLEEEMEYADTVRRLSRANLRRYPEILNPHGHNARTAGLIRALPTALEVPVAAVREALEKTQRYLHESAETAWRAAFRPHSIIITERRRPEPR